MVKIAPSLLAADFSCLKSQLDDVKEADFLHIDIMDGHFVPNISMGPFIVEHVKKCTDIPLDVHLMIENPSLYIKDFASCGADIITVHWESDNHIHRLLQQIKSLGCMAGVAFNPATSLEGLEYVIDLVDLILIMSVNPGFGGQKFIPQVLEKIFLARDIINRTGKEIYLEVDGGINSKNASEVAGAGANLLVAGSSVFKHSGGPAKGFEELKRSFQENS